MKRRRKLAAAAVVIVALIVVAAIPMGAWSKIHDKYLCLGDPPSRISGYQQTADEFHSAAELPRTTYSEPAVVIEMPAFTCPTYEQPTEKPANSPMGIWLKVSDNRFVGYVRGGGP
jgi:hypothetical protein